MAIEYREGDATATQGNGKKIIAHICNDIGGWGRGFVLAISKRWPEPEQQYRQWYQSGKNFSLGQIQLVQVSDDSWVANMIGQRDIHSQKGVPPIRYDAVESCLEKLADMTEQMQARVQMPRIGCGLAGGKWQQMEPIIEKCLLSRNIPVLVYDFKPE